MLLLLLAGLLAQQEQVMPGYSAVRVTVNWPDRTIIQDKYGKLRKNVAFGEVVGCNLNTEASVIFGEGEVIQALRLNGLQAFSVRDAISVIGHAQATSVMTRILSYSAVAVNTIIEAKATDAIGFNSAVGVALVSTALITDIALKNISRAVSLQQLIAYTTDGLQPLMQISPGRCSSPGSVLFGMPAPQSVDAAPTSFTMQVPQLR